MTNSVQHDPTQQGPGLQDSVQSDAVQDADVVVVGGGLAGLTAANYVASAGLRVEVLEARRHLGGRASTECLGGFLLNQGPHALYRGGQAYQIMTDLGLTPSGQRPPSAGLIRMGGTPHLAPSGIISLLRTKAFGLRTKIELAGVLARLPRLEPQEFANRTAQEWISEAVSSETAMSFLRSLTRLTTYCGQLNTLSADVAVAQLQLGLGQGVLYLDDGWATLVRALETRLRATGRGSITTGAKVTTLPEAPCVILAPNNAASAGALLEHDIPVGPPAVVACLDLGVNEAPTAGFVLELDQALYLSNHSLGAKLAPEGHYLVSVAAYLNNVEEVQRAERETRYDATLFEFAQDCGIGASSIIEQRYLHRMVATSAIPTPSLGGMAGRPGTDVLQIGPDRSEPKVLVAGDWVGPLGNLADAAVASGKEAARQALCHLGKTR